MSPRPSPAIRLTGVTLNSPDPSALARFYEQLLGWPITPVIRGQAISA